MHTEDVSSRISEAGRSLNVKGGIDAMVVESDHFGKASCGQQGP